ncbi:MAG: GGDEF domain-containing protein [Pseudomonadota bacterium]|nr:GGDEF domain-containing protein [Pseudomonadota bacterium]
MRSFRVELDCEDAFWLHGNFLQNLKVKVEQKTMLRIPRAKLGEPIPTLLSLEPLAQDQFSQLAIDLIEGSQLDISKLTKPTIIATTLNNFLIWPVYNRQCDYKIGVFIFRNLKKWEASWIREAIIPIEKVISRNIDEAFRFIKARELAFVDDLTGLYNQRYLGRALDREIAQSKRQKIPFSILFLDVDHFKMVNDKFGHVIGSKILAQLGSVLKTHVRGSDVGIRYGGDEYLLLLTGANAKNASIAAERIRKIIAAQDFEIAGKPYKITASIGVAAFPEHAMNKEELINLADQAMYNSKNSGRNKIYLAS